MTVACSTRGPAWRTMRPTRGSSAVAGWFGRRDIGRAGCDGGSARAPLLLSAPDHPHLKHSLLNPWVWPNRPLLFRHPWRRHLPDRTNRTFRYGLQGPPRPMVSDGTTRSEREVWMDAPSGLGGAT